MQIEKMERGEKDKESILFVKENKNREGTGGNYLEKGNTFILEDT